MSLGQAINLLVKEKNITKYKISKNSGIAQTTLSEIASGKNTNPTIETIEKIAKGIGITASQLIKYAEDMESNQNQ
ncbi:helix-turn-helix domain-containing protein [Clostridium butyricum]|jgi:transcriptional regulator with XRE-family HTH domain|uniref:helix-turn-helix domain-containing protein n=1 Tax=Clostridium butyricum TaxID=1492 RepID=UPI00042388E4|nr:helix-turn-helix transcriptional regulator [Clostridium butyricum]MCQ2017250.1 helix-turn-helix domain-containing protein [Clostridium butyricum]MCQ2021123.1 helix-turn-helix domain-containing protein [Clostridium butyricum]NFB72483.1 XRE family transcriptional regulator [Clostridium butyricum]NFB91592.1 XRE family transcriptional regulator [Clostridium butyricum]UTY53609.1 helix-turn-helix transcriptional regulator [Clostridium butyricum]